MFRQPPTPRGPCPSGGVACLRPLQLRQSTVSGPLSAPPAPTGCSWSAVRSRLACAGTCQPGHQSPRVALHAATTSALRRSSAALMRGRLVRLAWVRARSRGRAHVGQRVLGVRVEQSRHGFNAIVRTSPAPAVPDTAALSAHPVVRPTRRAVGVASGELVAAIAVGLAGMPCRRTVPAQDVLPLGYWLHVSGIHARSVAAQVIYLEILSNGADLSHVRPPVCLDRALAALSGIEASVSGVHRGRRPYPAVAALVDLAPEPLLRGGLRGFGERA